MISATGIYNVKWMMKWKGIGLRIVEVPSQHFPAGSEEYQKKPQL
jgi:hypothetical protein